MTLPVKGIEEGLMEFKQNMSMIAEAMDSLGAEGKTVICIIDDPVSEDDLGSWRELVTNEKVRKYNAVAIEVLKERKHVLTWYSSRRITEELMKSTNPFTDGIHLHQFALDFKTQVGEP
ncbi:unnamed protein product [Darwinula stevensoni]|uniref:Uncharacterized protein n=1 Tax=Darwinula stevensoni TaxID=69355 RepID=A0A7R9AAL5_9CRUS|nr:unnamed protein product [Darwinula stevensoni]CAG0898484.1 unnamed protein product [Darwinula stevensoni]